MVRPTDPNTAMFGVMPNQAPPERSLRRGPAIAGASGTAAWLVQARLNDSDTPSRSLTDLPIPAPAYQMPGEQYLQLP